MILLIVEHGNGKIKKSTYEMATAARSLGCDGPLTMLILGSDVARIAEEAAYLGDQVLVADLPLLAEYDPEIWAAAVAQVAREGDAHTVLIAGSRSGREYSPRLAVKLDAPLVEDVIRLAYSGETLEAKRYTYLARVTETVQATAPVIVVTIKGGSFAAASPASSVAEQFDVELVLPAPRVAVTARILSRSTRLSLSEADIVVAGGRGMETADAFAELVGGLADQIGAAVGATRAVVDSGWRPYEDQIGQTGKTVQPKLYVAIGISGAVQHLSGMSKSEIIVAINRDKEAPIFRIADYGIVGDAKQIVPAIIARLKD